jgi:mono/diheme cytochrome c family protein
MAGYIQQQGIPSPVDVAALLPPLNTLRAAILESASKSNTSASELFAQVVSAEQATERQANELRAKLAMQVASLQSTERIIGQVKEIQAVAAQQATISATANADQIPIADPTLKQIVATSCFQCHGGGDVKAGLDFKQAATFGAKEWRAIRNAVISGRMPKGGQPLDDNQQQFFEDYYDRVRTGLSKPVGT